MSAQKRKASVSSARGQMANTLARQYVLGERATPVTLMLEAQKQTKSEREKIPVKNVIHWFRRDIRLHDNTALSAASLLAKKHQTTLLGLYVISPEDYKRHATSPRRIDFDLRSLKILKVDLAKLDIPLFVEIIDVRKNLIERVFEIAHSWNASHLFGNFEYEVDEARRDAEFFMKSVDKGVCFEGFHDALVVKPGDILSNGGKPMSVYSPWFRKWLSLIHSKPLLLNLSPPPEKNQCSSVRNHFSNLFSSDIPPAAEFQSLDHDEKIKMESIWPAGEHEAIERLRLFLDAKVDEYGAQRSDLGKDVCSHLSVHFNSGTLSIRKAIIEAQKVNTSKSLDKGKEGITRWISELAWRDFYRHVLCAFPHICMNKSFKLDFCNIEWENNEDHWEAWVQGKTGYPVVDAGMRQLNETGYMHNRARMITASFLSKHLLYYWKRGEKHFMENLIDGDFASNNGGWGFSSSSGADPQPYFRIFNPTLQSEKFDAEGHYIRRWVSELKNVNLKSIHAPYERMKKAEFRKLNYPAPIVEHKFARDRCLVRYKAGLGRGSAKRPKVED